MSKRPNRVLSLTDLDQYRSGPSKFGRCGTRRKGKCNVHCVGKFCCLSSLGAGLGCPLHSHFIPKHVCLGCLPELLVWGWAVPCPCVRERREQQKSPKVNHCILRTAWRWTNLFQQSYYCLISWYKSTCSRKEKFRHRKCRHVKFSHGKLIYGPKAQLGSPAAYVNFHSQLLLGERPIQWCFFFFLSLSSISCYLLF